MGIDFELVPSNNHASPSGFLPFLLPALPVGTDAPIPSNKLQKWAIEEVHCEEEQQLNVRFEVYSSLLDTRIRNAWVCMSCTLNWMKMAADSFVALPPLPKSREF